MECISILIKHGAKNVGMSLGEDRVPDGLDFVVSTPGGSSSTRCPST